MKKRWKIYEADHGKILTLREELGETGETLCSLFVERGLESHQQVYDFIHPDLNKLHDPFLLKDMDKAVTRIKEAIDRKEKILVFGDYDVDGTTSVALMYRFLTSIYDPSYLEFYIPNRYTEGYGISKQGIEYARENNFTLIISLDCGIKAIDLVTYAQTLGLDFIVCDHHLPGSRLPPAVAILNPKQAGCPYPYKELCGCGVGFKLATALTKSLNLPDDFYLRYLDLVVMAIGADIVPITGENRILAYHGLKKLNKSPLPGIRALIDLSEVKEAFTINRVVFILAPRINAAGRMDDASKAVRLFIEDDPDKAMLLAEMLHRDNFTRREKDTSITEEALSIIESDEEMLHRKTTVLYREHWHKGVVGIVASRLIEKYYRPTVVLTGKEGIVGGSARSVPGFNLYEAIDACHEYLLGYGGHFAAAGMTLLSENVAAFSKKFEEIVSQTILPELLIPELLINAEISFRNVNFTFYNTITRMEPYGPENLRPVFITRNVRDAGYTKIVKEDHIRFVVKNDNLTLTGIGFNLADKFSLIEQNQPIDIVYTIDENEWNGNTSLQMKVLDFRLSKSTPNPET